MKQSLEYLLASESLSCVDSEGTSFSRRMIHGLYYVTHKDDYIIATDSGGRQRYIIGTLDDGEMFVEKIKKDKLTECYDMEEQW